MQEQPIESFYNGWNTWAKRVLHDIERSEDNISELYGKVNEAKADADRKINEAKEDCMDMINDLRIENAVLKTKVGLIGAGCGLLAAIAIEVITRLVR